MKIKYSWNNRRAERQTETAWKVAIGVIILSVVVLIGRHFGVLV